MKNEALESAPLSPGIAPKCAEFLANQADGVQHLTPDDGGKSVEISAESRRVLDRPAAYPDEEETISLEEAAARLGIEPKRLLGFAMQNKVGDPIGDGRWFYPSSLAGLAARLGAVKSVAP